MRKTIEFFVKYGIMSNIVIALTVFFGGLAMWNTKKSFFPERESRGITIQVAYLGASPEEMEEGITSKVEDAIRNIDGIDEINSTSSENSANISVTVLENFDRDEVFTEIKNTVDRIGSFPAGAERPVIFKNKAQSTVMWLGLTANDPKVDLYELKRYAEQVEDELLASDTVSQVSLQGYPSLEIAIEVSEENLNRYGLTFDQVANAVRLNNRDVSGGTIRTRSEEILIRSRARKTEAEKIGRIVVRSNADGTKLLLQDVATIQERFSEVPTGSRINGKQAVFVRIDKLVSEDLKEIDGYVRRYAAAFNAKHPHLSLEPNFSFMDMLQQRLDMLLANGAMGLVLVLGALGFFLSLRLSFWVAWGIPSSFFGLFIIGTFIGFTVNMISLFGMILVVGILVDDGIVIAENIFSHFERGKSPHRAAVDGTAEVLPAVATSVTTTMVAFVPLLFLQSFSFLRDMGIVVIASLGFSLVEAFFVLPAHLASPHVLRVRQKDNFVRAKINAFIDWMRFDIYGRMLAFTLRHKWATLAFVVGFFPITAGLLSGGFIKATFFPNIPFFSVNIDVAFKAGTREDKVEAVLQRFEEAVWKVNADIKRELGGDTLDFVRYTFAGVGYSSFGENGSHAGSLQLFYRDDEKIPLSSFALVERLRKEIGEVSEAEKLAIGNSNRFGKPVSVKLMGRDAKELERATAFLKEELGRMEQLKEVLDDNSIGRRELLLELRPQAYFAGLTQQEVARQIRQGFFGEEVQRFQKGKDEVRVWVRYPQGGRMSLAQLEDMKIKQQGKEYYLRDMADYDIERGIASVRHYQTARTVTVEAELVDAYAELPPILEEINGQVLPRLLAKFPSVKIESGGQARESARALNEILVGFGTAFLVIVILIMITFRSFYQGIVIISMIPLGWLGAIWGHGLETFRAGLLDATHPGFPISLLSAWGMIALSGVIINDAVVFLDKYNRNLKDGMAVRDAAYDAGISRFRPIMLTSLTTVLGLYPLILERSFQAQFLIPMAISVAYGIFFGTFIILLFFPVLIVLFNDARVAAKWLWTGQRPAAEEVERVVIDADKDLLFDDDYNWKEAEESGEPKQEAVGLVEKMD